MERSEIRDSYLLDHPRIALRFIRATESYLGAAISIGTAAASFELCSTSEVRTLRTCGAPVSRETNSWNVFMSGATHFRMKSTSPDSIQHSRTKGSARTNSSKARKSASAWLERCTAANTVTSKPSLRESQSTR